MAEAGPVCPYGATPSTGPGDHQLWMDTSSLPADWKAYINSNLPWLISGFAPQLLTLDKLCALPVKTPTPITVIEAIDQTAQIATGGGIPDATVLQKVWDAIVYGLYTANCTCNQYVAPDPTKNCIGPVTVTAPGINQSVALPSATLDAAASFYQLDQGTSAWGLFFDGAATFTGGAVPTAWGEVQFQAVDGTWVPMASLNALLTRPNEVIFQEYTNSTSRFGTTVPYRLFQREAPGGTVVINHLCLHRPPVGTPPPLPAQPDDVVAVPPTQDCSNQTLCNQLQELTRRMSVIAAQISDIQAAILATSQLTPLSTVPVSGEGELTLVLGTRAISVELTELGPEAFTSALGRPRGLMRVGSVRYGDGVGYSPRRFIDADRFTDIRPAGALTVSYQLLTGTSGTLTFLG